MIPLIKVSVIVPVYNKEKELEKCLDSLVQQTLEEIEIIVVDDASTDGSRKIIEQYQKKYPTKIKAYFNEVNQQIGKTRNRGLKEATGKYVGFVDGDDFVKPEMYQAYFEFAEQNNLDIVTGFYDKVSKTTTRFENPVFPISNIKERPNLLLEIDYGPCNKIFKRSLIEEHQICFEENLKYEDMPFVAKALCYAQKVGHIEESYYGYYIHEESETTTIDSHVYDMFQIMDQVQKLYEQVVDKEYIEALTIRQITRYMLQQKYQIDQNVKKQFIADGYQYLKKMNPNWRKNSLYKKENFVKRLVKNHARLLKLYCRTN